MSDIREEARAEFKRRMADPEMGQGMPTPSAIFAAGAVWADARKVDGDPREFAHIACDCVPDLGPEHCHLCGERSGRGPVPWSECDARKVEVTEDMVERAARAMWARRPRPNDPPWETLDWGVREEYRAEARAALSAALGGEQP